MKPKAASLALLSLALLTLAVPAHAGSGDLDTGFDGDGIFTWGLANPAEEGPSGVAVDPSTGDLVVGVSTYPSYMAVSKVLPGGGLDSSFAGGGTASLPATTVRLTNAIGVQHDGKVLAAGNVGTAGQKTVLVRYRANGNVDGSFADNGIAHVAVCGDTAYETNVFVRSDGSIAVVGDCGNGADHDKVFVLVFRAGGGLDGSFSGDGVFMSGIADDFWLRDATIDDHDRLTIVGRSRVGSHDQRATILRLTAQGKLDQTFSGDGEAFFSFAPGDDEARAVAGRGNGVLVAEEAGDGPSDMVVFALTGAGKIDAGFSGDGKVTINLQTDDQPQDLATDASGRIYIAATYSFGQQEATALRLKPNGALDTTFVGTGYVHTGTNSLAQWVIMWKTKPTVVGIANFTTDFDDLVARFLA